MLGDAAGYLAVAIRTSTIDDPALVHDSAKTLNLFSLVFGIPLSFGALLTGLALGLGTRWGVFRYPWVVAKLALIVSVILVGAFVIGPGSNELVDGTDTTGRLIAGATYDVVALTIATSLSVFKPDARSELTGGSSDDDGTRRQGPNALRCQERPTRERSTRR